MKIRNGFVSNSSSSSFIIDGDINTLKSIATGMLNVIIKDYGEDRSEEDYKESKAKHATWLKNLKKALRKENVVSGDIGITMPSCNYKTYIILKNGSIYVNTSNNHDWSEITDNSITLGSACSYNGGGDDEGEDDKTYDVINGAIYFNVENCVIASREKWWDDYNDRKCLACNEKHYKYVIIDGKEACIRCGSSAGLVIVERENKIKTK